jgi:hypothetical protein
MKTVVIEGAIAHRFEGRTRGDKVEIQPDLAPGQLRESIEYFRVNGLPPPEPPTTAELTFDRIVRELAL